VDALAAQSGDLMKPNSLLLDLRSSADFEAWHLPDATSLPLHSMSAIKSRPFADPKLLEEQWLELSGYFVENTSSSTPSMLSSMQGRLVVVACYQGDTSFAATSILRARNVEAFSLKSGIKSMAILQSAMAKEVKVDTQA